MASEEKVDRYTAQIVPDTVSTVSGQYFDLNEPFAVPRHGNDCTPYVCGRDYMKAVADAIRGAEHTIMIADWQLDYDVELDDRKVDKHPGRLSELLAKAIEDGVHVRVLLYDSVVGGPNTHEESSQAALEKLPKGPGSIKVMLQNANTGRASIIGAIAPLLSTNTMFSHHQKFVVVDGRIAFLGGIDLAYGRWETPAFDVVIDPALHVLNDAYNEQVVGARAPTVTENKLLAPVNGHPGFAPPLGKGNAALLDPATQPREPWEDVALRIEGPAVFDVFVNFVLRWNSFAGTDTNMFDDALTPAWFKQSGLSDSLVHPLELRNGSAAVQICRSASAVQLRDEQAVWNSGLLYVNDDWVSPETDRRLTLRQARYAWQHHHQTSILDAMVNCIRSAQAFIYIENQFFVSDCGTDERGSETPAKNPIISELSNAIGGAIYAGRPFHVWLVFPEHPEGLLEKPATGSQAWWALQGVLRGRNSLVNRINATLYEKQRRARKLPPMKGSNADVAHALAAWGLENEWRKYLTVLNLRNYGQAAKGVVTEMVYVHSKLTIVDDAVAIIGSANINDRSLLGNGDTELAAVVVDDGAAMTDLGQGVRWATRTFARELRMKIWRKHFGMLVDTVTTGVQKAIAPPAGIDVERPLELKTIQGIQQIAHANREAYNAVFTHTPRDSFKTLLEGRNYYPRLMERVRKTEINGSPIGNVGPDGKLRDGYVWVEQPTKDGDFSKMPDLQPAFMNGSAHNIKKAMEYLRAHVAGFFVEMPLQWGHGETKTVEAPFGLETLIADENRHRKNPLGNTRDDAEVVI